MNASHPFRKLGASAAVTIATLAVAACGTATDVGPYPANWRFADRAPVATFADSAMVVSEERNASEAGIEMLRQGGNAVDAAVATGFALAVTYPEAGNIGGGGYMVIRMADGRTAAIDYREMAPRAATRDMYLDENGELTDKSVVGHLAAGVPGAVAGMVMALERFGSLPLETVLAPAIRLADGFEVDSALHRSLVADSALINQFAGGPVFFPNGRALQPGDTLRQPALARTLRAIASGGARAFYEGWVADSVEAEMRRSGGIMTAADMAAYRAELREPIVTTFRDYTLLTMPPSSSGGITVAEALNLMETYDETPPFGSAEYFHRLAGAYQRAFIDRNSKLGDPAFVDIPIAELTSKGYAQQLRATMDDERAIPTLTLAPAPGADSLREGNETTHYSVVDQYGNAVATTTTINSLYGAGAFIPGAGFFLNNEMDDFAAQPGKPNQFGLVQGEANAVAPGKRPLSAMSPTIVVDSDGTLRMVVGARGGPRIITTTSQVILNVLEHGMTLSDAMISPRIHHQALPDRIGHEENGLAPEVMETLERMGHTLRIGGASGLAAAILRVDGGWHGMTDPRGRAVGGAVGF
jgi:gamma-glutamyltranspeptidase/glutathione hydrolase